jgi:hypothetical protein
MLLPLGFHPMGGRNTRLEERNKKRTFLQPLSSGIPW